MGNRLGVHIGPVLADRSVPVKLEGTKVVRTARRLARRCGRSSARGGRAGGLGGGGVARGVRRRLPRRRSMRILVVQPGPHEGTY